MYARRDAGGWQYETIVAGGQSGLWTSLALDSQSNPHVSHYHGFPKNLGYARRAGGAWILESVDEEDVTGQWTSLALDSADRPHIAYYDWTAKTLQYALKIGGSWSIAVVETIGGGDYISLALDSQDNPHISYYDAAAGNLRYARGELPTSIGTPAGAEISLSAYPNPTPGPVRFVYRVTSGGPTGLEIYDAGGRRVRSLLSHAAQVGPHGAVAWDGRDERGRAVAAGTYFVQLRTDASPEANARVTIVR